MDFKKLSRLTKDELLSMLWAYTGNGTGYIYSVWCEDVSSNYCVSFGTQAYATGYVKCIDTLANLFQLKPQINTVELPSGVNVSFSPCHKFITEYTPDASIVMIASIYRGMRVHFNKTILTDDVLRLLDKTVDTINVMKEPDHVTIVFIDKISDNNADARFDDAKIAIEYICNLYTEVDDMIVTEDDTIKKQLSRALQFVNDTEQLEDLGVREYIEYGSDPDGLYGGE